LAGCERQGDTGARRKNGITEQTYYPARKEFGSLQVDQAKRILEALSEDHARKLNEFAPQLVRTLLTLNATAQSGENPILVGEGES
jgi:hypothetical protein